MLTVVYVWTWAAMSRRDHAPALLKPSLIILMRQLHTQFAMLMSRLKGKGQRRNIKLCKSLASAYTIRPSLNTRCLTCGTNLRKNKLNHEA